MTLTKTLLMVATAGFLAACETPIEVESMPGATAVSGSVDASLVRVEGFAAKLDAAAMSGNAVTYAYYTDVVGELAALNAADAYCGGAGRANLNAPGAGLARSEKNGRGYNVMTFVCR